MAQQKVVHRPFWEICPRQQLQNLPCFSHIYLVLLHLGHQRHDVDALFSFAFTKYIFRIRQSLLPALSLTVFNLIPTIRFFARLSIRSPRASDHWRHMLLTSQRAWHGDATTPRARGHNGKRRVRPPPPRPGARACGLPALCVATGDGSPVTTNDAKRSRPGRRPRRSPPLFAVPLPVICHIRGTAAGLALLDARSCCRLQLRVVLLSVQD